MQEDLFGIWGLKKSPYWGDLTLFPEYYDRLFVLREDLVQKTVRRLHRGSDSKIILLSGRPGVGKSTFLDYINYKYFRENMKRIPLTGRLPIARDHGFVEFTEELFLYVFAEVEKFLMQIISNNNLNIPAKKYTAMATYYKNNQAKVPFTEFTRDCILPLCEIIHHNRDRIPRYFLAIDDVDYIYPYHQKDFLTVLCSMSEITTNPQIIYSARPVASGIATNHLNNYIAHRTAPSVKVDPIDSIKIIESRIRDVANDPDNLRHCLVDPEAQEIIRKLSCVNIRKALDLGNYCFDNADEYVKPPSYTFTRSSMIKCLYGSRSTSKNSEIDSDEERQLINILRAIDPEDKVPLEYIALLCVQKPIVVDEGFYKKFNDFLRKMLHTLPETWSLPENRILDILVQCHKSYLVRRLTHINFSDLKSDKSQYKAHTRVKGHRICLTRKGKLCLELTKEKLYQDLTALETWRMQVSKFIQKETLDIETTDPRVTGSDSHL